MSDSFNAQEILARLRAKTSNSSEFVNEPADSPKSRNSPNVASNFGLKQSQTSKSIKAPSSLTLTPSQRSDNLNIRNELEKDIKALQDEVKNLKAENKQLRADKVDVEQQFIDYKVHSENTIVKLRGKLAAISMGVIPATSPAVPGLVSESSAGGKVYPGGPQSSGHPHGKVANHHPQHVFLRSGSGHSPMVSSQQPTLAYFPPAGQFAGTPAPLPLVNHVSEGTFADSGAEGFDTYTFSEMMRRTTHDNPNFQESLRRTTNKRIPVKQSPHNSASKLPARNGKSSSAGSVPPLHYGLQSPPAHAPVTPHTYHNLYTNNGFNGNDLLYLNGSGESKTNHASHKHSHQQQQQQHHMQQHHDHGPQSDAQQNNSRKPSAPSSSEYHGSASESQHGPQHEGAHGDNNSEDLEVVEIDLRY